MLIVCCLHLDGEGLATLHHPSFQVLFLYLQVIFSSPKGKRSINSSLALFPLLISLSFLFVVK